MPLRISYKKSHKGTTLQSGHFYKFKYVAFENDPSPMVIFLNAIEGLHPRTGHQWRLIQAINLNYIPRRDRKRFVETWQKELKRSRNIKFTWDRVKSQYPYIQAGIRRYMLKPKYYIRDLTYIPKEAVEQEVIGAWHKDFSFALKRKLVSLKRAFLGTRRGSR